MALRRLTFLSAEGFTEETALTDEFQLAKATLTGLAGISLDGGAARAANFGDPTADQDLATKAYVDARDAGLDPKGSVRLATDAALPANTAAGSGVGKTLTADANGVLTVDGSATVLNDEILVKNEASAINHGIYLVTTEGTAGVPFVLTRRTDFDQDAEVTAGAHFFVGEGTQNLNTGWVLQGPDPITVDTTAQNFVQFSSAGVITAGDGMIQSGSDFDVVGADGIVANPNDIAVDLSATPGLEFDTAQLQVLVDPNGGIERVAAGIGVKLDGDSLNKAAAGLLAKGLEEDVTALETVAAGDPVAWSGTANQFNKGDADNDPDSRIMGVAEAAITAASSGRIVKRGTATGVLTAATIGAPQYLAATGGLTETRPTGNRRIIVCGYARTASDLDVNIKDYGKSAA